MAHTKQAAKRNRQNVKARARNKVQRSTMKTAIGKVRKADSADTAKAAMPDAMRKIDKAAKTRVIHPNAAARLKSRLAKKIASGR